MRGSRALALHASVSGLAAFVVTALWAMTGGSFWPIWVWYGLAIPLALHGALRLAPRAPRGRWRAVAHHGALFGWVTFTLVLTWAMAGSDDFWPRIPVVCLAMLLALHAVLIALKPDDSALTERVDELTRTRRGALDVQAHELRRIERDLHDGAQAGCRAHDAARPGQARLGGHPRRAELVSRGAWGGERGHRRAARPRARDRASRAGRPRPARRRRGARRAGADPHHRRCHGRAPAPARGRDRGLLRGRRVAHQRRQARRRGRTRARLSSGAPTAVLVVEIADDGRGGADPAGSGLTGLRHRVEALDGRLAVTSAAGHGTTIRAVLPI